MNSVNVIGRLVRDPEIYTVNDGLKLGKFTLAFSEGQKTVFVPVMMFGKLAEIAHKYLGKGSQVAVVGKLSNRKTDRGTNYLEVIADKIQFLSSNQKDIEEEFEV